MSLSLVSIQVLWIIPSMFILYNLQDIVAKVMVNKWTTNPLCHFRLNWPFTLQLSARLCGHKAKLWSWSWCTCCLDRPSETSVRLFFVLTTCSYWHNFPSCVASLSSYQNETRSQTVGLYHSMLSCVSLETLQEIQPCHHHFNKSKQLLRCSQSTFFIHCWLAHYFPATQLCDLIPCDWLHACVEHVHVPWGRVTGTSSQLRMRNKSCLLSWVSNKALAVLEP